MYKWALPDIWRPCPFAAIRILLSLFYTRKATETV